MDYCVRSRELEMENKTNDVVYELKLCTTPLKHNIYYYDQTNKKLYDELTDMVEVLHDLTQHNLLDAIGHVTLTETIEKSKMLHPIKKTQYRYYNGDLYISINNLKEERYMVDPYSYLYYRLQQLTQLLSSKYYPDVQMQSDVNKNDKTHETNNYNLNQNLLAHVQRVNGKKPHPKIESKEYADKLEKQVSNNSLSLDELMNETKNLLTKTVGNIKNLNNEKKIPIVDHSYNVKQEETTTSVDNDTPDVESQSEYVSDNKSEDSSQSDGKLSYDSSELESLNSDEEYELNKLMETNQTDQESNNSETNELKSHVKGLEQIQKTLEDTLKNQEREINEEIKNRMNFECDLNYEKTQLQKKKETEEEKRRIFIADTRTYRKFKANMENEKMNFEEEDIPKFFEAKYYVLKFMDEKEYLDAVDYNTDEETLEVAYKMYESLYNTVFSSDEEYVPDEMYIELIHEFTTTLPQKDLVTQEELMKTYNKESANDEVFSVAYTSAGKKDIEKFQKVKQGKSKRQTNATYS